jgi:hypothetical protein
MMIRRTFVVVLVLLTSASASAQMPDMAAMAANPVATTARMFLQEHAENIVGAATLMPSENYGYHPTPAQMSFGALMQHVAQTNVRLCSAIDGAAADGAGTPAGTAPKAALVAAVGESFKTCQAALANITDRQMADLVDIAGNKAPRAFLVMTLVADWADHYSTAASYLRMNDILPPTARAR